MTIGTCDATPDRAREIEAGFARHHHVEDQQIEMQAFELGARIRRRLRGGDAIAFAGRGSATTDRECGGRRRPAADAAHRRPDRFRALVRRLASRRSSPLRCRSMMICSTLSGSSRSIIRFRNVRTVRRPLR
ncbi:MAG: hypothetical protein QM703_02250 [Gemmatales bacterium]